MKTIKSRVVMLGVALAASVLLGLFLLKPADKQADKSGIPWSATALLAVGAGAAMWLKRRSLRAGSEAEGRLRCLERVRLRPGNVLHLIEVDGVRLLVSSGENGVRLVTRFEDLEDLKDEEKEASS